MTNLRTRVAEWMKCTIDDYSDALCEPSYMLATEDGRQVTIEVPEEGDVFYLYTALCGLPGRGEAEFYRGLLCMNLLGNETRGTTLAIDEPSRRIVLCYAVVTEKMDAISFANILGNFVETTQHVVAKVYALEDSINQQYSKLTWSEKSTQV